MFSNMFALWLDTCNLVGCFGFNENKNRKAWTQTIYLCPTLSQLQIWNKNTEIHLCSHNFVTLKECSFSFDDGLPITICKNKTKLNVIFVVNLVALNVTAQSWKTKTKITWKRKELGNLRCYILSIWSRGSLCK